MTTDKRFRQTLERVICAELGIPHEHIRFFYKHGNVSESFIGKQYELNIEIYPNVFGRWIYPLRDEYTGIKGTTRWFRNPKDRLLDTLAHEIRHVWQEQYRHCKNWRNGRFYRTKQIPTKKWKRYVKECMRTNYTPDLQLEYDAEVFARAMLNKYRDANYQHLSKSLPMPSNKPKELPHRDIRPCWYKMYVGECPVCGRDASYKVRMLGTKPKDAGKRYVFLPETETYDHCVG